MTSTTQSSAAKVETANNSERLSKVAATLWTLATIAAPLVIYFVFSGFYIYAWYARTHHQGSPPGWLIERAMFITYPPALWATVELWWLIHRGSFSSLFGTRSRTFTMDALIGIVVGGAWVAFYGLGGVVSFADMFTFDSFKLASTPMSLSAGFGEEFLFRGFLFFLLTRANVGWKMTLILSSVAFGLGHVFWGPAGMFWTVILGLSFGLLVHWRRSVWPAVIAHALLDLCIEPGLFHTAMQHMR